ncbi:hypothetical protein EV384_4594 [Micromonospora kangleipakensis]|uniref:Uncharacterized protein n=1 Tax=Micromonospora kangleipakensis TaxID=1077942 RepID=A0A4Q8BF39_9ACTN|nr:hypothetical protein EV384_4594 [Micromonospora kangleipakensis]
MAALVAGGRLERGGAVPGREVRGGVEPADVADVADQAGCPGRANAVQVGQGAAVRGDELTQLLVRRPDLGVDRGQFLDEFAGQIVTGLGDDAVRWRRGAQQVAGLATGEELLRSARDEFEQQVMDAADGLGAARPSSSRRSTSSRITTVTSSGVTVRRPRLRRPATATLCASTASVLRPWPVSKTRTRADSLAGTSRTVSPSATSRWAMCRPHTVAALDRPHPVAERAAGRQHLPVAVAVGAETAPGQDFFPIVDGFDRGRPLVRIHPDHHATHVPVPPSPSDRLMSTGRAKLL